MNRKSLISLAVASGLMIAVAWAAAPPGVRWSDAEVEELRTMWIGSLEAPPADLTNRVADDPRAADLGRQLFFDTRLSANGRVACATCHKPDQEFQDGTPLANGIGMTNRRTMPIAGMAYSPFLFWDGRKDSQWAQALGPLESPVEHGGNRDQYAGVVAEHYRPEYEQVFGTMPALSTRDEVTAVFVNIGKAIAAYERRVQYAPSRFDAYVVALTETGRPPDNVLTPDEVAGLKLFTGKANCTPQRAAADEQRIPQHRRTCRADIAVGSRSYRGLRGGGERRIQLPQQVERCARYVQGARVHDCGVARAGARIQGSVAAERRGSGAVHARRSAGIARGRAAAL